VEALASGRVITCPGIFLRAAAAGDSGVESSGVDRAPAVLRDGRVPACGWKGAPEATTTTASPTVANMRGFVYRGNWTTAEYAAIDAWLRGVKPDVQLVALLGDHDGVRVERKRSDGRTLTGTAVLTADFIDDLNAAVIDLEAASESDPASALSDDTTFERDGFGVIRPRRSSARGDALLTRLKVIDLLGLETTRALDELRQRDPTFPAPANEPANHPALACWHRADIERWAAAHRP